MKKLIYILFILIGIFSSAYSQATWEFYEKTSDYKEIIHHSLEFKKGRLITVSTEIYKSNDPSKENLFKSNIRIQNTETGEVTLKKHYSIDSLSASLSWIFYNDETKNFIIAGEAHNTTLLSRRGYFLVTIWDENLNFISDTLVKLEPLSEYNVIWILTGNHKKENEWVIIANYNDNKNYPVLNSKLLLVRINKQGIIENFKYYLQNSLTGKNTSIFFDDSKNQYILFGWKTYFLNTDFEKVDSFTTSDAINYYGGFSGKSIKFTNSEFLISARFGDYDKGLALFDRNLKFIKGIKTKNQDKTFDVHFARQNFDYIDTTEIYFGVQNGFLNYYSVGKVNSNLDPYWIKYFSLSDSDRHYVWSLTATQDGGCVIVGAKGQDYENEIPNDLSAWAIKLDADGNTVSTKDPDSDKWEITVFPNPSSGDFKIDIEGQSSDAKLVLYDIQGREVKRYQNLSEGTNTFIFDELPAGTYVWKLLSKDKEIGDGKWVKLGK